MNYLLNLVSQIILPFIATNDNIPINVELELTRAKFEHLSKQLLARILIPLEDAN